MEVSSTNPSSIPTLICPDGKGIISDSDAIRHVDGEADLASSQIELNVKIIISPGIWRYSILIYESSLKPYMDQRFSTLDSGIEFYRRYTANCGFYIRPRTTRLARDGYITNKYVFCHKEGDNYSAAAHKVNCDKFSGGAR
ncbi:hypothetical protein CASFOL_029016 [Castilleja foliolosa]|uniref:Uncharacterized protein n=1 Tax=Castilleja foliolosa TaxID=1961234 RepID=A0ABD3CCU5_9LAMI